MSFDLRAASPTDADNLLGLWREAAENDGRPADTREAVLALIHRDPEALTTWASGCGRHAVTASKATGGAGSGSCKSASSTKYDPRT